MATHEQEQQAKSQQEKIREDKAFPWQGLSIAFILILGFLLLGLGCAWLLSRLAIMPPSWLRATAPIFSFIGVTLGWFVNNVFNKDFFQEFNKWLFQRGEESKAETPDHTATATIKQTPTIEQSPTLTFNPTIIIDSSPRHDQLTDENISFSSMTSPYLPQTQKKSMQSTKNAISDSGQLIAKSPHLSLDPSTIFLFNEQLDTPNEFYGRELEREILIGRTHKRQSTSIVGTRRIGKTWLINYLRMIAPTSPRLGLRYRIGYLDASLPSCKTADGFIANALRALEIAIMPYNQETLQLSMLERAVEDMKLKNQIPILCIDEFEGINESQNFDISFFTGLRAIAQAGLGLITVSKRPLIDILYEYRTSPFFNIFEQITLKPFTLEEAETFVQIKGKLVGFTEHELSYLLKYGQQRYDLQDDRRWPPLRLQLVGKLLLEDKRRFQTLNSNFYRPDDLSYWWDFEKRLEEKYQAVVRT